MPNQNKQINTIDNNYLYKKTEKVISALYLLSSFISDKEPLKWKLREVGLELLYQILPLSDNHKSVSLFTLILSYLESAYLGGIISEMNFNILKIELENLIKLAQIMEQEQIRGAVLADHFLLATEKSGSSKGTFLNYPKGQGTNNITGFINKGQNIMSDRLSFKNRLSSELNQTEKSKRTSFVDRQERIISLLKKSQKELGIKDITASIKDCGEKTIQRELVALVSKGLVCKEGEKRWSRYSAK